MRRESCTPRLPLIRVAPKTTLRYLMKNMALRLYANVTHRVRHVNGPILGDIRWQTGKGPRLDSARYLS